MDIKDIGPSIKKFGAEAWIMVDYENSHPILRQYFGSFMLTRKLVAVFKAEGKPVLILHDIDFKILSESIKDQFDMAVYKTWGEMLEKEKEVLSRFKTVLMDVSECGLLPRVSLADFGSVEYVKSLGIEVLSSADLQQFFTAVLSKKSLQSQEEACKTALKIKNEAFAFIASQVRERGYSDEYEVQQFICDRYRQEGMVYDEPPIVAIGPRASNPHYAPTKDDHAKIMEGDLVLIDMWAKFDEPGSVYSDITWMGYVGEEVPRVYVDRFNIVKAARDGAINFLAKNLPLRPVEAYEVDDVARKIITDAGYGEYFTHRLGHSIADGESPHGPGANLDNFETHDFRKILENTSFSDEPGIYAPDFGVRSETDLQFVDGDVKVVGGLQEEIVPIMALVD